MGRSAVSDTRRTLHKTAVELIHDLRTFANDKGAEFQVLSDRSTLLSDKVACLADVAPEWSEEAWARVFVMRNAQRQARMSLNYVRSVQLAAESIEHSLALDSHPTGSTIEAMHHIACTSTEARNELTESMEALRSSFANTYHLFNDRLELRTIVDDVEVDAN